MLLASKKIEPIGLTVVCFLLMVFFLRQVFFGVWILPQTFQVGPLTIHYYGVIMAVAVAAAFYLAIKRAPAYGLTQSAAEDLLFWLIIGGFIGARAYHVASSYSFYLQNPGDILRVWNGGLSIYGAVIGGVATLLICKKTFLFPLSTFHLLDWLAPSLALGQIIGRFGNLFNYEAFGYPTNLPWKMFVPLQFRPVGYESFSFFHPFFLYEAIGSALILFVLLKLIKTKNPGVLFFSYLLLYNLLRFGLEFLRIDSTFIGYLRLNAISSFVLVIISILGLIYFKNVKES